MPAKIHLLFALSLLLVLGCASAQKITNNPDNARQIAKQAYIFGFPLLLTEATKNIETATPAVTDYRRGVNRAPINQFAHVRSFADPVRNNIPGANLDMLSSVAWVDLSKEPMVLTLPDTGDRYSFFTIIDAWTSVAFSGGTRTTGNLRKNFVIIGPQWTKPVPEGLEKVQARTNLVRMIGQVSAKNAFDFGGANYIQDRYKLTPLSQWGQGYTPPKEVAVNPEVDAKTPPLVQVQNLSSAEFFSKLAELMKKNPPGPDDTDTLNQFVRIGLLRGRDYDVHSLPTPLQQALEQGLQDAKAELAALRQNPKSESDTQWTYTRGLGDYGDDYKRRALNASMDLNINLEDDAVFLRASKDAQGKELNGKNRYVIRFHKDNRPPAKAYWSLTMYDDRLGLVKNSFNRSALSDRNSLAYNRDGSLDLYIQTKAPQGKKAANWLPTPKGNFILTMRLYWPGPDVLDGTWRMPEIERVGASPRMPKTARIEDY
jgi:hypothetical protein